MDLSNQGRQAAMSRMPAEAGPEMEPAAEAMPQGGGEPPVPVADIAMYLKAILPTLPEDQQEAVGQAAEILSSVGSPETPDEMPVESEGVNSEEMGGVPARQ